MQKSKALIHYDAEAGGRMKKGGKSHYHHKLFSRSGLYVVKYLRAEKREGETSMGIGAKSF
jgi:hypothetical protein